MSTSRGVYQESTIGEYNDFSKKTWKETDFTETEEYSGDSTPLPGKILQKLDSSSEKVLKSDPTLNFLGKNPTFLSKDKENLVGNWDLLM